jgi:hypothetical protein
MTNSTKFKIVGINNSIAKLEKVGGGFCAYADDAQYIGSVGETVEVLEKDYTPEGDLGAYQTLSDRYDGTPQSVEVCIHKLDELIEVLISNDQITAAGNRDEVDRQTWTRLNDIRELITTGEVAK